LKQEDLSFRRFVREEVLKRSHVQSLLRLLRTPIARGFMEWFTISIVGGIAIGYLVGNRNGILEPHELTIYLPLFLGLLQYWYWYWRSQKERT